VYGLGQGGPASYAMPGPAPGELAYYDDPRAAGPGIAPAGFLGGPYGGGAGRAETCDTGGCGCGSHGSSGLGHGGLGHGGLGHGGLGHGGLGHGGGCLSGACGDGLCNGCGGTGCLFCGGAGCNYCGGAQGCGLCGSFGSRLGLAPVRNMIRSTGLGAHRIGADGCMSCGWGNNALLPGYGCRLLGRFAPFADGAAASRMYDAHVGTIALSRNTALPDTLISTIGPGVGTPALRMNDLSADELAWGLTATVNVHFGPGSSVETTYFGLNRWDDSVTVESGTGDLYSLFSDFGIDPPGGFADTDQSLSHTLSYKSAIHSGEVNFRRRLVAPQRYIQGSWLAGVRYFDLDEDLGFAAVGQPFPTKFFNMNTQTRNQMVGFQAGGDAWLTLVPGFMLGFEGKSGIYGNNSEVDTLIVSNSVPLARETISDGRTAYLHQIQLMSVYRLSYSWSFRAAYHWMRVDNVALAPNNFSVAGLVDNGSGLEFGPSRRAFIDNRSDVTYNGFTLGAEYLW
jgi:hypothetical protein